MIKAEKLSYGFPQKELYHEISFTIEEKQHCAFIGSNGTGKTTLVDIICNPEKYIFDGKLKIAEECTIGWVNQFYERGEEQNLTVFEYISSQFVYLQDEITRLCDEMATAENMEEVFDEYQKVLDQFTAMDGDHYESNIKKQLKVANLEKHQDLPLNKLSGGEFKLVQVIKEMMASPRLLIMDEPDVFLDFEHLTALADLINYHKGTLLVITHNRYLLNHCFNKILHLENTELQEFDGSYVEYNFLMLQNKITLQELAAADQEEIERNEKIVEKMRKEATALTCSSLGRSLHARVSLLERLEARKTKDPFIDIKQPPIRFVSGWERGEVENEEADEVLNVENYHLKFQETLLEDVNFSLKRGEKVAIVGANGTGKTTMLRDIWHKNSEAVKILDDISVSYLSQIQGEILNEDGTLMDEFLNHGFDKESEVLSYLNGYGFEERVVRGKISALSGGEKNLLQIAKITAGKTDLLLLDEPTSHLDTYTQITLEEALADYDGTVLMVSHDFYTIVNCADYVLLAEDKNLRKVSIRKFRKMIYANHFDKDYLEIEQKKKELEKRITLALKDHKFENAKKISEELETVIEKLKQAQTGK